MPLYEYACQDCGTNTELLVRESLEPTCPECGSSHLSRMLPLISAHSRDASSATPRDLPAGPCGSACGCFPQG